VTRRKNQHKPNGHAGPHGRANGHAPASTERGGVPAQRDRTASDDASGASAARAASTASAAGTVREACADAPPPRTNGELREAPAKKSRDQGKPRAIPPGEKPLPADPGEFVEEIHKKIDLTKVWRALLRSKDPKIKQRAAEKLTEMRYKGAAALADEPQRIIIDMPGPHRD